MCNQQSSSKFKKQVDLPLSESSLPPKNQISIALILENEIQLGLLEVRFTLCTVMHST